MVARQPIAAHQVAQATTQCEAGDAGGWHQAAIRSEPHFLRRRIEFAPQNSAAGASAMTVPVDLDALHRGEIDDQAVVTGGVARNVVRPSPNSYGDSVLDRESNRRKHVVRVDTADDPEGSLVDHPVPDSPRRFIVGVLSQDDLASNAAR